jgi:Fibronectin type III domain
VKRLLAIGAAALLTVSISFTATAAEASAPKAKVGASCATQKTSAKVKVSGKTLVCAKTAMGAKIWKVVKATVAETAPIGVDPAAPTTSLAVGEPNPTAPNVGIYPIVLDPNGGGINDPTPRTPEQAEAPNSGLAPAPTGLAVSNVTDNSVTVSWDPIPEGALYQVYVRHDDSYESFGVDNTYSSHTFSNLTSGWDYTVGLYAALPRESNISNHWHDSEHKANRLGAKLGYRHW